ncbi:hypothetical protein L3X38_042979 [Prunus dulcis]|uniref:Uncharacterized protein n=1 Tax=Prunus dulcis TaxID=3755 RepID=A0AAD4UW83_PRUDU|nr:hypothetical protein L3X38_042979 [Prunus dulcis]
MVFGLGPALMFTVREQNKVVDALAAKSYDCPLGLHVLDMEPFFLNNVPAADATVSLIQGGFHGFEVRNELCGVVCMLGLDIWEYEAACGIRGLACKEVGTVIVLVRFGVMQVTPLGLDILDFGAVCSIGVLACKEGVTTGLVDI